MSTATLPIPDSGGASKHSISMNRKFDLGFIKEPFERLADWALHPHKKCVYEFNEGSQNDKSLLGNKGANLCEMSRLGLPVPPGFVITTETCIQYFKDGKKCFPNYLIDQYTRSIHEIERKTGRLFSGHAPNCNAMPLLLSVRSGAAASMPGMMDTVLNLGMNDDAVQSIALFTNNPRFAYDTYRRFLQMFGQVVLGIDKCVYESAITDIKKHRGVEFDSQLVTADLQSVVCEFKKIVEIPSDPWEQLKMAIEAVFCSWYNPRAVKYRDINGISADLGTAVSIQSMVYGNFNDRSGSGVAFTRNPGNGDNKFFGEYLSNAEGEDVVAGIRTPMSVDSLESALPDVYESLLRIEKQLEHHYRDMQDIEFTVENGTLFILQTRNGKRTARAAVKIAVAMVQEYLITEREALLRIDAEQMNFFLHPMIDPVLSSTGLESVAIGRGLAASAGAAIGSVVFNCCDAQALAAQSLKVILCREETCADDIAGLEAAEGVLTMKGGITSHAAVVMRGMGKSAVTGARSMVIDVEKGEINCVGMDGSTIILHKGDIITIDGSTGNVYNGIMPTVPAGKDDNFQTVLKWANEYKRLSVLCNAETAEEIRKSIEFGAEGVGLVRTEHMFFSPQRINVMRSMILSTDISERSKYLDQMRPLQQNDLVDIFRLMQGKQVTVRLLDPPLHEFLPSSKSPSFCEEVNSLASHINLDPGQCMEKILNLEEVNPMLGFRGCRLSVAYPEITAMQTRAIIAAVAQCQLEGFTVAPEIMIPMVCTDHEIDIIAPVVRQAADEECKRVNCSVNYKLGCMIEVPRACMRAGAIAAQPDMQFLSIGTNDLTQLMLGCSRDDTSQFMPVYLDKHIFARDPFITVDQRGVGAMIALAVEQARKANSQIKIGVCGEHGGDPSSISFFDNLGVDYISCSPYRLPIAIIAAAQSHIHKSSSVGSKEGKNGIWAAILADDFLF